MFSSSVPPPGRAGKFICPLLYGQTRTVISSVQFSLSVMSNSLQPHESQHARPPCPSPTPGVHSDSGPSSQWCHPAISSSVIPFSSCPRCLLASESFPMSQLFAWGGQSPGVSGLAWFLPKKSQHLGKIFLGLSTIRVFNFESHLPISDCFLCAQSLFWGYVTWWHHWADWRSYFALLFYCFGSMVQRICLRGQRICFGGY